MKICKLNRIKYYLLRLAFNLLHWTLMQGECFQVGGIWFYQNNTSPERSLGFYDFADYMLCFIGAYGSLNLVNILRRL